MLYGKEDKKMATYLYEISEPAPQNSYMKSKNEPNLDEYDLYC